MSPESFEWTAQQGYNLLYVAYHVDHPVAVERIGWYQNALKKNGRRPEDHEICCVYHAHFLDNDDDERLRRMVDTPMSEYAAAGIEAARKPPDPSAYKGYERREAGQRRLGFETYYPGRVVMGGPKQAIERIRALRDVGITQIGLLTDFGSLPQVEIMRSLQVLADKVLPHVRDL
jgi:alkanesulfonate monooxygenase SsuD/methylene tetrahydromethanopterin reductase-like flavin-dependent oxidoreductase (luciferase family)